MLMILKKIIFTAKLIKCMAETVADNSNGRTVIVKAKKPILFFFLFS